MRFGPARPGSERADRGFSCRWRTRAGTPLYSKPQLSQRLHEMPFLAPSALTDGWLFTERGRGECIGEVMPISFDEQLPTTLFEL